MDQITRFYEAIKNDMVITLATSSENSVTMRTVSPVLYNKSILFFTAPDTEKFRQLADNPNCCVGTGNFFAQAKADFRGKTMSEENTLFREVYSEKFPGAFEEGIAFGGRSAEFIILKPFKLKGWAYENGVPDESGIPTIPFEIDII